jgi:hypothetical protein
VAGLAGAAFAGRHSTCNDPGSVLVSRLHYGQLISNRQFSSAQSGVLAIALEAVCDPDTGWRGQFDGKGVGFIAFKFNNGSGDQYGWVRIRMPKAENPNQDFRLIDYAYGDVGDRVRAGQTSSNAKAPDKGSLGWLALGAVGLLAWRKSRSPAAR